jgi:hypothetical protein
VNHTPGPWFQLTGREGYSHISNVANKQWAAPEHIVCETTTANAARIVACVNACEGINPAAVPDLLTLAIGILDALEHEGRWTIVLRKLWARQLRAAITLTREVHS